MRHTATWAHQFSSRQQSEPASRLLRREGTSPGCRRSAARWALAAKSCCRFVVAVRHCSGWMAGTPRRTVELRQPGRTLGGGLSRHCLPSRVPQRMRSGKSGGTGYQMILDWVKKEAEHRQHESAKPVPVSISCARSGRPDPLAADHAVHYSVATPPGDCSRTSVPEGAPRRSYAARPKYGKGRRDVSGAAVLALPMKPTPTASGLPGVGEINLTFRGRC